MSATKPQTLPSMPKAAKSSSIAERRDWGGQTKIQNHMYVWGWVNGSFGSHPYIGLTIDVWRVQESSLYRPYSPLWEDTQLGGFI